jgi:hypothetical protein
MVNEIRAFAKVCSTRIWPPSHEVSLGDSVSAVFHDHRKIISERLIDSTEKVHSTEKVQTHSGLSTYWGGWEFQLPKKGCCSTG